MAKKCNAVEDRRTIQQDLCVVTTNYNQDSEPRHTVAQRKRTMQKLIIAVGPTSLQGLNTPRRVSSNVALELLTILTSSFAVLTKSTQRNRKIFLLDRAVAAARFLTSRKTCVAGQMSIQIVFPVRSVVAGKHTIRILGFTVAVEQSSTLQPKQCVVTKTQFRARFMEMIADVVELEFMTGARNPVVII